MGYVSLLVALLFYTYALAGIHLFGPHDPKYFGSLPAAFLSLFQLVTLDNWSELFHAQTPFVPGVKVAIYFVTFIVFGTMIILNLFIGIIMNSMSEMHAEIAERDRAKHERETDSATIEDELRFLESELKEMQARLAEIRRRWRRDSRPAVNPSEVEEFLA